MGCSNCMNCSMTLGCERITPPTSHQIWLSAPPVPRSALSSTLVVGVISFPMDLPKSWGFCGQKIGGSSPMLSPPSQSLRFSCSACAALHHSHQSCCGFPAALGCFRVEALHSAPGNLLSFLVQPLLCLLF